MKKINVVAFVLVGLLALGSGQLLTAQTINTYAGTGVPGHTGDGGLATAAQLNHPHGNTIDAAGNFYVCDLDNNCIRKITPAGIITNIAGNGIGAFSADGAIASSSSVNNPFDVVIDNAGNVYFTEYAANRVRKINTSGILSTIAGNGASGATGDGGPATSATLSNPAGIARDAVGNIYISVQTGHKIRKIATTGIITTVAGTGSVAFGGDGGPATAASFSYPNFLTLDNAGNLLITDNGNFRIRKLNVTTGIITTIAGNGSSTFGGDGGPATAASLYYPGGVAVNAGGGILIADNLHNRIRLINSAGVINTVAGNGVAGYSGDGGPATSARVDGAVDVCFDAASNFYISDFENHRVRVVTYSIAPPNNPPLFNADDCGYVTVCQNSSLNPVGFLDVSDIDAGQTETFSVLVTPSHGTLAGFPTSVTSTGGVVNPVGITYTPTGLYYGADTFTIVVFDGSAYDTLPFSVSVLPNTAGAIVGPDVVCIGSSISLTNYIAGGIWSSTNNTLATVSATGVVFGNAAGVDTIRYSLPNLCNAGTVTHIVTVLTPEECTKLAVNNIAADNSQLLISPNPNNGSFTLNYSGKNDTKIVVTDITGRKIANYEMTANKPLDIRLDVAPGIYFLTAFDRVSVKTVKMVVVR